jgi:hypothetical protein
MNHEPHDEAAKQHGTEGERMKDHWCGAKAHPEYAFGTSGSLVLTCPKCSAEHFRNPVPILHGGHKEYCVECGDVVLKPVQKEQTSPGSSQKKGE